MMDANAERVSSYDVHAQVPKAGSRWVWEVDEPHARALIEVVESVWNGEEWWVRTRALPDGGGDGEDVVNDLSRFWEAVTPVGGTVEQLSERRTRMRERRSGVEPAGTRLEWKRVGEPDSAWRDIEDVGVLGGYDRVMVRTPPTQERLTEYPPGREATVWIEDPPEDARGELVRSDPLEEQGDADEDLAHQEVQDARREAATLRVALERAEAAKAQAVEMYESAATELTRLRGLVTDPVEDPPSKRGRWRRWTRSVWTRRR